MRKSRTIAEENYEKKKTYLDPAAILKRKKPRQIILFEQQGTCTCVMVGAKRKQFFFRSMNVIKNLFFFFF